VQLAEKGQFTILSILKDKAGNVLSKSESKVSSKLPGLVSPEAKRCFLSVSSHVEQKTNGPFDST